MLRIGKMTDYAILLLTYFARDPQNGVLNARDLAEESKLPSPTVSKILKHLTRGQLLESLRGVTGGYRLAKPPSEISIARIISLFEGPVAMTECSSTELGGCEREVSCPLKDNWRKITIAVSVALEDLSLANLNYPPPRSPNKKNHKRAVGENTTGRS